MTDALLFSCCDHCGCCDDCGRPREGHDDTCQHGCNDTEEHTPWLTARPELPQPSRP